MKFTRAALQSLAVASVSAAPTTGWEYVDWKEFKATGTNLGGWLVQEAFIDPYWWGIHGGNSTMDEWTWCKNLGDQCGPVLEEHYATFINETFIDELASVGSSIIRIPTTYAAWIDVPWSELYHGNQVSWLSKIATYAIEKYDMHIIIDVHSLPGGINGLDIGEASGHLNWWFNQTNLDLSYQVIDQIINYVQLSGHPNYYTIEPINEPQNNLSALFSPNAITDAGKTYLTQFYDGVLERITAANPKIPMGMQVFPWDLYSWADNFDNSSNIVYDMHHYYFVIPDVNSGNLSTVECTNAKADGEGHKFPVFFGEWAIQTGGNNSLADREKNFQTAQSAYNMYGQGSAMWTGRMFGNISVAGQGVQGDYWNYEGFIELGYVKPVEEYGNLCQS